MNRWIAAAIGSAIGLAAGALYNYLFAPAPGTTLDGRYQSRLDWALAEGERAAVAREAELRAELAAAKQPKPRVEEPPAPAAPPADATSGPAA